ncbi:MAG: hypothetical protein LC674_07310 [Actinobacteria bacterium]|nr:hypothetical protein [Actinomycetota bacterium]
MGMRFCSTCNSEVEESGGYCLLGHGLALVAPRDSLTALRAEVDQAFEDARAHLTEALVPPPPPPPPASTTPPPASPAPVSDMWAGLDTIRQPEAADPINSFAPPPRMDWGPNRARLLKRLTPRMPRRRDAEPAQV